MSAIEQFNRLYSLHLTIKSDDKFKEVPVSAIGSLQLEEENG